MSDLHKEIAIIDLISEDVDWFSDVTEDVTTARRVKASSTKALIALQDNNISDQLREWAMSEVALRRAHDKNHEGNPMFESENAFNYVSGEYDDVTEELSITDPVEKWIAGFVGSEAIVCEDLDKRERVALALNAYYTELDEEVSLATRREIKVVKLAIPGADLNLARFFVESNEGLLERSLLEIRDLWESFVYDLTEAAITVGSTGVVKCIAKFGFCRVGETFKGKWKQAARPTQLRLDLNATLPLGTSHPIIFYNKDKKTLDIPKQFELL